MEKNIIINNTYLQCIPNISDIGLVIADPIYDQVEINYFLSFLKKNGYEKGLCVFMMPEHLLGLREFKPDQICHWMKPESTKNTQKNYSKFIEVICMWNVKFYGDLHWSNRTGIFTDRLLSNKEHPWKKPESLIEKLILNHYPGKGIVFDPFAGSFTVDAVCRRHGIPSVSVEIDKTYFKNYSDKIGL